MKSLAIAMLTLAVLSGLCGLWCASASLAWCSFEAWTWNEDEEDDADDLEAVKAAADLRLAELEDE